MAESKQLDNVEVKSLGFNELTQDFLGAGEWEQELNAFLDAQTLKGTFFNDDWVFLVNDLVAEHFSSSPMRLVQDVMVDDEWVRETVDSHPIYDLLDRPNPFQDYHSWQYNWAVEFNLMGNAFEWWNDDNSIALVVPAETVMMDFDKDGNVDGYIVSRRMDELLSGKSTKDTAKFKKENIFHQMRPNPASLLWGLSPFIAPRKSILFNRYTQDYINGFYLKGATPGMVLEMENNISEEGALRLLRSFEASNTGRRNNRRTLLLPKGVSAKIVTPSMADQQILELTESTQNKILAALKVPKHAFSLAQTGSLGSEETKQALRFFYKSAILPLQKKRAGFLTMKLRDRGFIEPNQFLEFDNSDIEYIQDDTMAKAALGNELKGQWTVNEIRQEIWEKEPVEGGDVLESRNPFQEPIKQVVITQAPQHVEASKESEPDQKDRALLDEKAARKAAFESRYKHEFEKSQKQMDEEVRNQENQVQDIVLERFARQLEEVYLPLLKEELEKEPKRSELDVKAESDRPKRINRQRFSKRAKAKNAELDESLNNVDLERYVEALEGTTTRSFNTQIRPTFAPDKIDALTVLRDEDEGQRRTTLAARGLTSFEYIDETSINLAIDTIAKGVEDRKTILEIAEEVKKKFGEVVPGRSETIARTEVLTAVSIGRAAAMDAMREVFPEEKVFKLWLTAKDSKVRDSHADLDGDIVEVGKDFDNGLEYPREPGSPGSESINCFIGETEILSHTVRNVFKRFYRGKVASLKLSDGTQITGTLNHPVLTSKGWVPLGKIDKSCQIVKASLGEGRYSIDPNIGKVPAAFEKIYTSLSNSFRGKRVAGSVMDFHGDGMTSDVNIVNVDGLLGDRAETGLLQELPNVSFLNPLLTQSRLLLNRCFNKSVRGIAASHRRVSGGDLVASFYNSLSRPFKGFGFTKVSPNKTQSQKPIVNSLSTISEGLRNYVNANSFFDMKFVEVEDLTVWDFSGHVYNLSTENQMYLAQGAIVHNCRCDVSAFPESELEFLREV